MFGKKSSRYTPCAVSGPAATSAALPFKAATRSRPLRIVGVLVGLVAAAMASSGHSQPANPVAEYDLAVVGGTPGDMAG